MGGYCECLCLCACVPMCVFVCIRVHVCMCICITLYMCMCTCVCVGGGVAYVDYWLVCVFRLPVKDIRQRMKQVKVEEKLLTHPQQVLVSICTAAK